MGKKKIETVKLGNNRTIIVTPEENWVRIRVRVSTGTAVVLLQLVRVKKKEEPTLSLIGLKLHQLG